MNVHSILSIVCLLVQGGDVSGSKKSKKSKKKKKMTEEEEKEAVRDG